MVGGLVNTSYGIPNYILVLDTHTMIVSQNFLPAIQTIAATLVIKKYKIRGS